MVDDKVQIKSLAVIISSIVLAHTSKISAIRVSRPGASGKIGTAVVLDMPRFASEGQPQIPCLWHSVWPILRRNFARMSLSS